MANRVKEISFTVIEDTNEWISLRNAMCFASQKDADLKRRMENSTIIFQKTKLKKSGEKIIVDVDEESEQAVEDECDLNVIFCPTINENLPNINASKDHSQTGKNCVLFDGLLNTIDVEKYQYSNSKVDIDFSLEFQNTPSTSTRNQQDQLSETINQQEQASATKNHQDQVYETDSAIETKKKLSTRRPTLKNLSTVNLFEFYTPFNIFIF